MMPASGSLCRRRRAGIVRRVGGRELSQHCLCWDKATRLDPPHGGPVVGEMMVNDPESVPSAAVVIQPGR